MSNPELDELVHARLLWVVSELDRSKVLVEIGTQLNDIGRKLSSLTKMMTAWNVEIARLEDRLGTTRQELTATQAELVDVRQQFFVQAAPVPDRLNTTSKPE